MEPSFSSHIHIPVSKDLLLKHIQQISKSENIRVLLNPTQWFPLHCTSYGVRGFDWSGEILINPEVNIHFVTAQFRHFLKTVVSKHLGITRRNMAEPK